MPKTSLEGSLVHCGGPQPLAGEQVAGLLLRDPDLSLCSGHDHGFTKSLSSFEVIRQLLNKLWLRLLGNRHPSLADYVMGTGATRGATAAGGG